MAEVRLSDVFVPEIYTDYAAVNSPETTEFYNSGIVVRSDIIDQRAKEGGRAMTLPFWKDLDGSEDPNVSSDDPADIATPSKIGSGTQICRAAMLNNGWSATDLAGELAGSDPMRRIASRTNVWWSKQWQKRLLGSAVGVLADNVANDSSDMVEDISIQDGANAAAVNIFSRKAFTGAAFTLGDAFQSVSAIGVHSVVLKQMVDNDDIDFIKDSEGNMTIPTFLGRRVIHDDGMPVEGGGTSGFKYTSILFGAGAFGYGDGAPKLPFELERSAAQGNGAGVETLWERKSWVLHPFGYQFTSSSVALESASVGELAQAANWDRVVERKNVPMAFLVTNG